MSSSGSPAAGRSPRQDDVILHHTLFSPVHPIRYFSSSLLCREQQSIAAATTYIKIERREEIPSSHRNGRWCCFWPKSLTGSIVLRKNSWAGFPANQANICLRKRTVVLRITTREAALELGCSRDTVRDRARMLDLVLHNPADPQPQERDGKPKALLDADAELVALLRLHHPGRQTW